MAEVPTQINPVMLSTAKDQRISDPFVREAYFGSPDTPGIISQATDAANRVYGQPAIMRQTAGLSPLELSAIQSASSGIGSYQPYIDANLFGIQEGIEGSRLAGELAQPYFTGQDQFLNEAATTARGAAGMQYDPSMTQNFYNPYENQVVQQTLDDLFKQGEMQDVQARAQNINSGGESAFGSRARLSADERRAALGRGVGEALANIRSGGFQQAQNAAIGEFGRQQGAQQTLAGNLANYGNQFGNIGAARSNLARTLGQDFAGYGGQASNLGRTDYELAARERSELANYGATARGVKDVGLGREYDQAYQTRMAPTQAASYVKGFLPQYQSGMTDVRQTYGIPVDPLSQGIGTIANLYANFAGNNNRTKSPYT